MNQLVGSAIRHLIYRWDGKRIAKVLEVSEMKRN
jgi:hypothetical protein